MAATGYTPISLYYSTTASAVPTAGNLANGELALNIADMKLYAKNSSGTVTLLASNASTTGVDSLSFGSTGLTPSTATTGAITVAGTLNVANGGTGKTSYTANGVLYASGTGTLANGSALTFDGTTLSNTGSGDRAKFGNGTRNIYIAGDTNGVSLLDGAAQTGNGWYINGASNYVAGFIGSSEQMRLTSTGLGIGTSSPSFKLDVQNSSSRFQVRNGFDTGGTSSGTGLVSVNTANSALTDFNYRATQHSFVVGASTATAMLLDSAGNLGLGVTPSAWSSSYKAFQVAGQNFTGTTTQGLQTQNAYYDGTSWKYIVTAPANYLEITGGQYRWNVAPSGTAGNPISFTQAMTLDASGNLGVGTSSPSTFGTFAVKTSLGSISIASGGSIGARLKFYDSSNTQTAEIINNGGSNELLQISATAATGSILFNTNSAERARINSSGAWSFGSSGTNTGTSGQVLTSAGSGAAPTWASISGGDATNNIGYLNIPQNAQTGSYTLVLSDAGKHIYHASGAGAATYTIPANGSVAYPIGTAVTFINLSSTAISIAITTDTMYLSSAGTTGTRTLAQYGSATAIKITSTAWMISGSGLT